MYADLRFSMEFCTVKNHQFGLNSQNTDLLDLLANFSSKESERVLAYHKTLPGYKGKQEEPQICK